MLCVCFRGKTSFSPAIIRDLAVILFRACSVISGCLSISLVFSSLLKKYSICILRRTCILKARGERLAPAAVREEMQSGAREARMRAIIPPSLKPNKWGRLEAQAFYKAVYILRHKIIIQGRLLALAMPSAVRHI